MSKVKIDLRGFKGNSKRLLDEGWYPVTIIDTKMGKSSKEQDMLTITFELDDYPGFRHWERYVLEIDWHMDYLRDLAVACNYPTPDMIDDVEELHGLGCLVKMRIVQDQNRIRGYKPLEKDPLNPMAGLPTLKF